VPEDVDELVRADVVLILDAHRGTAGVEAEIKV